MSYVITPAPHSTVLVANSSDLFPVHRIYCVGRNYAAHAREMGGNPEREPPFFFCKPADAVVPVPANETIALAYPPETTNYHHEIELVVAIGKAGKNIPEKRAHDHIWGYAVGLDMTRRDLQTALREKGQPWELAKAFDQSAPVGPLYPVSRIGHPKAGSIWLKVNDEQRQTGRIEHMIWSITETIGHLSRYFELRPGDLIFTGTPAGVGPVVADDMLRGGIDGLGEIAVQCVAA
ncbi:MAG: fumarylacetoacetate hydrolase family protein [Pseudomonadota bacterium]